MNNIQSTVRVFPGVTFPEGASDEPYDAQFCKWMIREKVCRQFVYSIVKLNNSIDDHMCIKTQDNVLNTFRAVTYVKILNAVLYTAQVFQYTKNKKSTITLCVFQRKWLYRIF